MQQAVPPLRTPRSLTGHLMNSVQTLKTNQNDFERSPAAAADFAERARFNQRKLSSDLKPQYDFIVCGSGSSGSVVARRLAVGIPIFESHNGRMMEGESGASIIDVRVRDGKRQSVFRAYTSFLWLPSLAKRFVAPERVDSCSPTATLMARLSHNGRPAATEPSCTFLPNSVIPAAASEMPDRRNSIRPISATMSR